MIRQYDNFCLPDKTRLKRRVQTLIKKLNDFYPVFKPKKRRDPMDELVLTILSQNTNDINSFEGFTRLKKRFSSWDDVAGADLKEIAKTISVAGLGNTKAKYIKGVLEAICDDNVANSRLIKDSGYHLNHLKKMALEEAIDYLTSFKGVGQKTAACVLAFSLGMPSFPIDTHVHRILKRQAIIPEKMPVEKSHQLMYSITDGKARYRFHVNLIKYGREVCHARNPECLRCVIRRGCTCILQVVPMCLRDGAVEKARIVGGCACPLDRDKHRAPTRGAPTILYFLWFFNSPETQAIQPVRNWRYKINWRYK
ncbi:MAG: hypothetical protein ABIG42_06180 [bacterium]